MCVCVARGARVNRYSHSGKKHAFIRSALHYSCSKAQLKNSKIGLKGSAQTEPRRLLRFSLISPIGMTSSDDPLRLLIRPILRLGMSMLGSVCRLRERWCVICFAA